MGDYELPCRCWDLKASSLQEQHVFLTSESPFQPVTHHFKRRNSPYVSLQSSGKSGKNVHSVSKETRSPDGVSREGHRCLEGYSLV